MRPPAEGASLLRDESGAAILEFALLLPLLLVLVFGGFEIGRALLIRQAAEAALRGGARFLARVPDPACRPSCPPGTERAVALARGQILANTGLGPDVVEVEPEPEPPPGTVLLRARIRVPLALPGALGGRTAWRFDLGHQESRVGE